jgi:hypothetical protein
MPVPNRPTVHIHRPGVAQILEILIDPKKGGKPDNDVVLELDVTPATCDLAWQTCGACRHKSATLDGRPLPRCLKCGANFRGTGTPEPRKPARVTQVHPNARGGGIPWSQSYANRYR